MAFLVIVLVLGPFVSNALTEASVTRYLSNARALHTMITVTYLENGEYHKSSEFLPDIENPKHGQSSTDYFRYLMEAEVVFPDFLLFALPGTGVRPAERLSEFSAHNNAWSVVSGLHVDTSSPRTPLLLTRNLNESALLDWRNLENPGLQHLGRIAGKDGWRTPFDRRFLCVLRLGGGGEVLKGAEAMMWERLNPESATNVILQP